jgi:predicted flap endonuclease-1-like 5' DNA nuclease
LWLTTALLLVLVIWYRRTGVRLPYSTPARRSEMPMAAGASDAPTEPDNLRRIEGIGPVIAGVLQEAGIATFAALAATDVETLRGILRDAGLARFNPAHWPEQARRMAREAGAAA